MRLIYNSFVVAAAVAFSVAAAAQTTPPPNSPTVPDEPVAGQSQTPPAQTPTTPGQMQTEPGTASQTTPPQSGQTPSGQKTTQAVAPATAADVKAGASVYDQKGGVVGKVQSVSGKNAVVDTGTTKAQIPLSSFAKSDKGLVIGMTKAELDAAAKKSTPPKPK